MTRAGAVAPSETALLTPEQVAAWFQISPRQVERLKGVPWVTFGARSRRALVRSVLTWLAAEAKQVPSLDSPVKG